MTADGRRTGTWIRRSAAGRITAGAAALLAGAAVAGAAGLAQARTTPTLKTAANGALHETIVVDSRGVTLYELRPETVHHLLCKSASCLSFWPPYTVASAKTKLTAAKGVPGRLGLLRRGHRFQVTLDGRPLYRFVGDGGKAGSAAGQGLATFGGTWHVVKASTPIHATSTSTTTGTSTGTGTMTTTPTGASPGPVPYPAGY